jgi:hypothetical protein
VWKPGLAYVVIPSQFHQARDLSGEQEQQRPANRPRAQSNSTYLSSPLASKLLALDFSIEFIRAHSVTKNHSAELEVKEILEDM